MSFTVMHRKGDKIVPIRMSIWDALKGVPDLKTRKLKLTKCSCCGKIHGGTAQDKTNSVKEGGNSENNVDPTNTTKFTDEDDAVIIRMKESNTPWKDIADALGKSNADGLKDYWKKTLQEKVAQQKKAAGGSSEESKQPVRKPKSSSKFADGRQEGKKIQEDGQKKANNKTSNTMDKPSDIKAWAAGYDRRKWLAAASKHYDLTGQRITPEMARKMAEGK